MTFHDRLLAETAVARDRFLAIPLLGRALEGNVPRAAYVDFLGQAYHHVRHTCPLLSLAAARTTDAAYRTALYTYVDEELGHDDWILDDIAAMGGDPALTKRESPRPPCRAMVGYAYYAVEWISPYAMLGMVHVLEGMSTQLASRAAGALQDSLGYGDDRGFGYLTSHGDLDVEHVAFFQDLVNGLDDPTAGETIVDSANVFYWLYGSIFHDLGARMQESSHAA